MFKKALWGICGNKKQINKFSQGHNFLEMDSIQNWGKKEGKKRAESVSSDFFSASNVSAITTFATLMKKRLMIVAFSTD